MRTSIAIAFLSCLLISCSPQDKEKARADAHKTAVEVREDLKTAGHEIKKDLHKADEQLHESMEKGKETAQRAAKDLRREINDGDPDRKPPAKDGAAR